MKKRYFSFLGVLLVSLLFCTTTVNAKIAQAGDDVTATGKYNSSRFVAGNEVKDESEVDGVTLVAGNNVKITGKHAYGFYAGNNITITGTIEKDLFVAGNKIVIDKDATIGRDLYIAGDDITIKTNINGNIRVAGSTVNLSGIKVNGNVYTESDSIKLDKNTEITGKLSYYETAEVVGKDDAKVGSFEEKEYDYSDEDSVKDKVKSFIIWTIAAFITMVVLFFVLPSTKEKLDEAEIEFSAIAKKVGIGLLLLIAVPLVALIISFTGILTPVGLITLAAYVCMLYVAVYLSSYIIGKEINTRLFKKDNVYLSLCIGILVVKLLKFVPVIGGLVTFTCLLYGLGSVFEMMGKKKIDTKKEK